MCVSGWGLEGDIFLPASASALEAAPTFNRHERSRYHPFFFFLFFHLSSPCSSSPFLRCTSNPSISWPRSTLCPPHLFSTRLFCRLFRATLFTWCGGSHLWGCHDDGHVSMVFIRPAAGCCADLKWHSLDGLHFSLFFLLYILIPISWAICCASPYHHHHHGLHYLSSHSEIWAMRLFISIIQTCQSNLPLNLMPLIHSIDLRCFKRELTPK